MSTTSCAGMSSAKSTTSCRHGQLADIGKAPRVRVRASKAHQLERWVAQCLADDRGLHAAHEERGIEIARLQRGKRGFAADGDERRIVRTHGIDCEQRQDERARTAAFGARGDPPALQLVQHCQSLRRTIEDPKWLVIQARQHLHAFGLRAIGNAALQECNLHARLRVEQQAQVFSGAFGRAFLDDDAVARQRMPIALGVLVIEAEARTRREHDATRGRGLQELRRHPEGHGEQCDNQQDATQLVPARERGKVVGTHGRGVGSNTGLKREVLGTAS